MTQSILADISPRLVIVESQKCSSLYSELNPLILYDPVKNRFDRIHRMNLGIGQAESINSPIIGLFGFTSYRVTMETYCCMSAEPSDREHADSVAELYNGVQFDSGHSAPLSQSRQIHFGRSIRRVLPLPILTVISPCYR